jgi:hypothetical protein
MGDGLMASNKDHQLKDVRIVDKIYSTLRSLTGEEFEVRKDQDFIYIYHSDRNTRKKATSDCILHAMYGVVFSSGVRSIYIDGFGVLSLATLKKHIHLSLCKRR